MVKLDLRWSREHVIEFSKQIYDRLLKDNTSEYFDISFYLDGCNIKINDGEILQ